MDCFPETIYDGSNLKVAHSTLVVLMDVSLTPFTVCPAATGNKLQLL